MPEQAPILIIGGGIAGLTLALALARRGLPSHILEQRGEFSELGAGIQLGPNATRILAQAGLLIDLKSRAFAPEHISIGNGQTGEQLTSLAVKPVMEARFGAPYLALMRADLQNVLLTHARANELITITTGFRLDRVTQSATGITALNDRDDEVLGHALIGADGIWSRVRQLMFPSSHLLFSGKTAWRALMPIDDVPENIPRDGVGLWLGSNAHLVHYPVGSGPGDGPGSGSGSKSRQRHLNIVAFIHDPSEDNRWSQPADMRDLIPHFKNWAPSPRILIEMNMEWRKWSLFDASPLGQWQRGRMCLVGDAAHPVLPFLAQGGAMAIEDAEGLARSIDENDDDIEIAFEIYEAQRQPRATKVQNASRQNGKIYHMKWPLSLSRDLVLKSTSPDRLLKRYDWLYGFSDSG